MFIFERDRVQVGKGQRERERERQRQRETETETQRIQTGVNTQPDEGLEPTNCEIMTCAKVGHLND